MANLVQWRRPSMLSLQRDLEDAFDELSVPRSTRREMERLFDDFSTPRTLWREMERVMDELEAPPRLGSRISRIFERFLGEPKGAGLRMGGGFVPSLDLIEQDNEYVMKVDLPGMREQDIDVRVSDDNMLTVSGERREEESRKERGYEYNERSYGRFTRSIELPQGVDTSKIQADFRNGVLELHVPRTEGQRGRKIPLSRGEEPRVIGAGNGPGAQGQQQGTSAQQPRTS